MIDCILKCFAGFYYSYNRYHKYSVSSKEMLGVACILNFFVSKELCTDRKPCSPVNGQSVPCFFTVVFLFTKVENSPLQCVMTATTEQFSVSYHKTLTTLLHSLWNTKNFTKAVNIQQLLLFVYS